MPGTASEAAKPRLPRRPIFHSSINASCHAPALGSPRGPPSGCVPRGLCNRCASLGQSVGDPCHRGHGCGRGADCAGRGMGVPVPVRSSVDQYDAVLILARPKPGLPAWPALRRMAQIIIFCTRAGPRLRSCWSFYGRGIPISGYRPKYHPSVQRRPRHPRSVLGQSGHSRRPVVRSGGRCDTPANKPFDIRGVRTCIQEARSAS
jgi:hypothetical protein